jgi:hypothetical protein
MKMETPLERVLKEIDEIKEKIEKVEIERNNAAGLLKAAVVEFEFRKAKALLESANTELTRLGQEKLKLIDERRDLEKIQNALAPPVDITGVVSSYLLV